MIFVRGWRLHVPMLVSFTTLLIAEYLHSVTSAVPAKIGPSHPYVLVGKCDHLTRGNFPKRTCSTEVMLPVDSAGQTTPKPANGSCAPATMPRARNTIIGKILR